MANVEIIRWWKMGIWRIKGMRGNTDKGVCRREEGGSDIV
jgi:hypothetical protein